MLYGRICCVQNMMEFLITVPDILVYKERFHQCSHLFFRSLIVVDCEINMYILCKY